MAIVDAQIVLALAWVETQLKLEQLPAYSEEQFLDLAQLDLLLRERWSAIHWTVDKREQTPLQGPGLTMAPAIHLSSAGEHGCDEPHDEASRLHTISHPVNFAQFLSVILACPAETVLALLHLLFSRDLGRQHLGCNTELVAACALRAWLGTARCLKLLVARANLPSSVRDF